MTDRWNCLETSSAYENYQLSHLESVSLLGIKFATSCNRETPSRVELVSLLSCFYRVIARRSIVEQLSELFRGAAERPLLTEESGEFFNE